MQISESSFKQLRRERLQSHNGLGSQSTASSSLKNGETIGHAGTPQRLQHALAQGHPAADADA
jgi:hypothetical protein